MIERIVALRPIFGFFGGALQGHSYAMGKFAPPKKGMGDDGVLLYTGHPYGVSKQTDLSNA